MLTLQNMKNLQRNIIGIIVLAAIAIVAYTIGKSMGEKSHQTTLINNYSFVKNIIELAGLEVSGNSTYTSSNVDSDGGFWKGVQSFFIEKSASVSIPYTAKYGVQLKETDLKIERQDSVVLVSIPTTQLLSFELHLDRLQTTNKKGLLIFEDDEFYNAMQKKLYANARQQLSGNSAYLQQSKLRIEKILQGYYTPLGLQVKCVFIQHK